MAAGWGNAAGGLSRVVFQLIVGSSCCGLTPISPEGQG